MSPSISVIIPTYNGGALIGETLDSLARQSEPTFEVIVVDDGSSDNSAAIAEAHPAVTRVLRQQRSGAAVARNRGAAAASGDYVTFLDHDDLWWPRRHARLRRHLLANPLHRVVMTRATEAIAAEDEGFLMERGARWHRDRAIRLSRSDFGAWCAANGSDDGRPPGVIGTYTTRQLLSGPPSLTTTFLADRELWLASGGCVTLASGFDDYLAVMALSRLTPVVLIDEPSVLYRVHPGNATFRTEWALPMLLSLAWMKSAGGLETATPLAGRRALAPLVDERKSWLDKLFLMADGKAEGSLADSFAIAQLAAADAEDRRRAMRLVARRRIKRWLRR